MKNVSIFLTLGILLISAAVLTSLPRNAVAQAMNATDYMMTEEEIKTKITDFKAKHPKFAAILEEIPNLDLKETIKAKDSELKHYKRC